MVGLEMMCFPLIVKGETGAIVNMDKMGMYKGGN